jgi:hypothetical protein
MKMISTDMRASEVRGSRGGFTASPGVIRGGDAMLIGDTAREGKQENWHYKLE